MRLLNLVLAITINGPVSGQPAQEGDWRMHGVARRLFHNLNANIVHHILCEMMVAKTQFHIADQLVIVINQSDNEFRVFRM